MDGKTLVVGGFLLAALLWAGCARSAMQEAAPPARETPAAPEPEAETPEPPPEPGATPFEFAELRLEVGPVRQLEENGGLYNAYNPKISDSEEYIAFEVSHEDFNRIYVYRIHLDDYRSRREIRFERVKEVSLGGGGGAKNIEEMFETALPSSFNYEFAWFPGGSSFIFSSNAGVGKYNLFLGSVERGDGERARVVRSLKPKAVGEYLMLTESVKKDGQAKVSPDGARIVFASGRTGNGDLYLLDISAGTAKRLTSNEGTDMFPEWSPDGREIVFTSGGRQSHDIHVIRDVGGPNQREEVLVKWFFDDVLPSFSPDGKRISFYTTYNEERDPFNAKRWGLMIIPSDGSGPAAGKDLIGHFRIPDVVKDNYQGTAWFPDGRHIAYAKSIDGDYNPIYIYDVESGTETFVQTGTEINHDITVSPHGLLSFRAQVLGWDRIFVADTTFFQKYHEKTGR